MNQVFKIILIIFLTSLVFAQAQEPDNTLELPTLSALELKGEALKVVATTSIIADVVAQVGGNLIDLSKLIQAGQDPHSYEPAARDLSIVSQADIVFINGWDLEESLITNLANIVTSPLVPVSANIEPLEFSNESHSHQNEEHEEHEEHEEDTTANEHAEHQHGAIDPHTWFSISNVKQWTENIQTILSQLDPQNASSYEANAAAYIAELNDLENYASSQLNLIAEDKRYLVSNHDTFGYFARDYNFEVIGAITNSSSTLAEASASDLVELIKELEFHQVCTLFTENISSARLANTLAQDLKHCSDVKVLALYTDALGELGGKADSYIKMYRTNVDTIVEGLKD